MKFFLSDEVRSALGAWIEDESHAEKSCSLVFADANQIPYTRARSGIVSLLTDLADRSPWVNVELSFPREWRMAARDFTSVNRDQWKQWAVNSVREEIRLGDLPELPESIRNASRVRTDVAPRVPLVLTPAQWPAFSAHTAFWLSRLSVYAYLPAAVARVNCAKLGFHRFVVYDHDETQCYVAANQHEVVVVFRGTELRNEEDWKSNEQSMLLETAFGSVHAGYAECVDDVWNIPAHVVSSAEAGAEELSFSFHENDEEGQTAHGADRVTRPDPDMMSEDLPESASVDLLHGILALCREGQTLWITGHSLGGALGILLAGRLATEQSIHATGVYTFGSPPCFAADYARAYNAVLGKRTHRIVNNLDNVPEWFSETMSHVGRMRYIPRSGQGVWLAEEAGDEVSKDITLSKKCPSENQVFEATPVDINVDHNLNAYREALKTAASAEAVSAADGETQIGDKKCDPSVTQEGNREEA